MAFHKPALSCYDKFADRKCADDEGRMIDMPTAFLDNFDVAWTAINQLLQTDLSKLVGSEKVEYNNSVLK